MTVATKRLQVTSFTLVWIKIGWALRNVAMGRRHELHARVD